MTEEHAALVGNILIRQLLEHSPWLAKRVILLFVPSYCGTRSYNQDNAHKLHVCDSAHGKSTIFSTALEEWLHRRQGSVRRPLGEMVASGTIREAYVMNLAHTTDKNNRDDTESVGKPLELRFSGINGVLPNMDVVAGSLACSAIVWCLV